MKITKLELIKSPKGHQNHQSGGGVHKDKRTKRNRTRSDKNRKAILEY
jgi:hypothetical protein